MINNAAHVQYYCDALKPWIARRRKLEKIVLRRDPRDLPLKVEEPDNRDLILAAHQQLGAPLVWCRGNVNVHLAQELANFDDDNKGWLRIFAGTGVGAAE